MTKTKTITQKTKKLRNTDPTKKTQKIKTIKQKTKTNGVNSCAREG
jgi:hypothetical protein